MSTVLAPRVSRESALRKIADGLRLQSEGYADLAICDLQPRLVASRPEAWLNRAEIAAEMGLSVSLIDRLTRGKSCRRQAGRRVQIERGGLSALLKRG